MTSAGFDYAKAASIPEALELLRKGGGSAVLLAGGQSLIPMLQSRAIAPRLVVDIGHLDSLKKVRQDGRSIVIGAGATYSAIIQDPLIQRQAPLLVSASKAVGDMAVRNLGTIGGAIAHTAPVGDLPCVLVALDCEIEVESSGGLERVHACDFFTRHADNKPGSGLLIVNVIVPIRSSLWNSQFEKLDAVCRLQGVLDVAAAVEVVDDVIISARIGINNFGGIPIRPLRAERQLVGSPVSSGAIIDAADLISQEIPIVKYSRISRAYHEQLVWVAAKRALGSAIGIENV